MSDDSSWRCLELALLYHAATHPFCSCAVCAMVASEPTFETVASDAEAGRIRTVFNRLVSEKGSHMRRTAHEKAVDTPGFSIRALPGCGLRDHFLPRVPDEVLEILTEAVIDEMGDARIAPNENILPICHSIWERTRSITYAPNRTIESALSSASGALPIQTISALVRALASAGQLEETLRAERDRIDATLKYLALRRAAAVVAP